MKTNYLLFLSFAFLVLTSFSITKNSISKIDETEFVIEKDTFNSMASHGIYLREDANLTSKKLAKLPYSTKLVFLNQDTISEEITIQETKYFEIKGRMQKVKVVSPIDNLNNLEGYVFDGYLTKFPVPVLNYETEDNDYLSSNLNYFKTNFEEQKKKVIARDKFDCEGEYFYSFKQTFGSVIEYKEFNCSASGNTGSFKFNGLTIREAYFISYVLFFREDINKELSEYYKGDIILFDKKINQIRINYKSLGCSYTISQKEGFVFFEFDCTSGC